MADILIVDDNEEFRRALRKALERAGHTVRDARNGAVALAQYGQKASDLIILDIIMPEKEGIETIVALRRLDPAVKIVAISGGGRTEPALSLDVARKLGARRTLIKPFTQDVLLDAVAAVLGETASP